MKNLLITLLMGFSFQLKADVSLNYGETSRPEHIDPYTTQDASAYRMVDLLFDSLIELEQDYSYSPSLAKSYSITKDGKQVLMELSEQVKWHPYMGKVHNFTSDDVLATVRLLLASDSGIPNKSRFDIIESVQALDKYKVLFTLKRASVDPLKYLGFKILPAFRFKEKKPFNRNHEFGKNPTGTGPYLINDFGDNGEIKLVSNPSYFKGNVNIPAFTMKPFTDQNIMTQALLFESLDLLTYVSPKRLDEVLADQNFEVKPYASLSYSFIGFNTKNGLLSRKLFRQALNYSINRKEMLKAFFENRGNLISGPFPPSSWAYNLDVKPYEYDIKRAKSTFQSIGLKYDGSGKLLNWKKQQVSLSFLIPIAGEKEMNKRIGVAIQAYLQKVGINLKLEFVDWHIWKQRVLVEKNYEMTVAMWNFDDAANIESLFHSSEIKPWGNNFVQYSNPEVDALLAEGSYTNDFEKKIAIFHKLHSILAVESPYLYLWTLKHHAVFNRKLSGVKIDPFSFFKYVKQWRLRKLDKVM
ncbi:MAG: ABC transporter substrate-binding protein [Oligoflexales bacterium]